MNIKGYVVFTVPLAAFLLLLAAACGTGNRMDVLDGDAFTGGYFLPPVQKTELRLEAELTNGRYEGGGLDLTFPADTSSTSGAAFTLPDQTTVHSGEQIYDYDGNGVVDYIVLTVRSLSAQARGSKTVGTTILDGNLVLEERSNFYKVGGAGFEPGDATFNPSVIIFLPLDGAAAASPGDSLPVYKFNQAFKAGSDDVGTNSGYWELEGNGTVEAGGFSVSIAVQEFGEYAVVVDSVIHNQGTGGDV